MSTIIILIKDNDDEAGGMHQSDEGEMDILLGAVVFDLYALGLALWLNLSFFFFKSLMSSHACSSFKSLMQSLGNAISTI